MCFKKPDKWKSFEPTPKYLAEVSKLDTVEKLSEYTRWFTFTADIRDYWKTPIEMLNDGEGDCLEENTDILIKNSIKKIKDIEIGDLVLSYNYASEEYEYKKVINKWDKGILEGNIIKLKNGNKIIATDDHRFFCRTSEGNRQDYEVKRLKDINLEYWCKRQIHCVYSLPEGEVDIDKDLAYIYGIYLAEGYSDGSKIQIAQDKQNIRNKIENALNNLKVPYSKSKRTKHAYYNILKGEIKDKLKTLGSDSFNKNIPIEFLNWNKESLKYLMEGMLDGDGTDRNKKWNPDNSLWEFSTSSEQVAKIFNVICRKVYGNCWFYKQEVHQGVGNKPIYRLRYNPKGLSNEEIFNGISSVSIKSLEKISNKHYYDIEVEDNHNFVLADSGVISHNCEDFARWYVDILTRVQGISEARFVIYNGLNSKKKLTGHGVCVFPYKGALAIFTNNIPPILGFKDFVEAGHYFYPNGLKYMEIRDWNGKILSKKRKWIGVF